MTLCSRPHGDSAGLGRNGQNERNEEHRHRGSFQIDVFVITNPNTDRIHRELLDILKRAHYEPTKAVTAALEELLWAEGGNVTVLCLMVNVIIDEAVCTKPRVPTYCVKQYAAMFWTINNYTKSIRHRHGHGHGHSHSHGQNEDDRQWVWSAESLHEIQKVNFFKLLWQRVRALFREVQVGADRQKWVNVMVLLAELYNSRLLLCAKMVEVMDCILGERSVDRVGRSDIDGLYEIFKRCSGRFRKSKLYEDFEYYLDVLFSVKSWNRFKNAKTRYPSVAFMVDEMHRHFYGGASGSNKK